MSWYRKSLQDIFKVARHLRHCLPCYMYITCFSMFHINTLLLQDSLTTSWNMWSKELLKKNMPPIMENTNVSKSLCIVVCSIPNIVHKQQSNWQVKNTLKTGVRKLYGKEVRVTWQILSGAWR